MGAVVYDCGFDAGGDGTVAVGAGEGCEGVFAGCEQCVSDVGAEGPSGLGIVSGGSQVEKGYLRQRWQCF